ncbi:MAG: prepilin-type N-terminal cleavage/methylation domain-containing protein [Oscillospiraceae bacterium]|nr:prepilin-type N-terminal cleavage/methylation domain-containing protein [Oscillospiraceae bacterium]
MKIKKALNKKGFTIIEIIAVLVIIAILAAAGIPSMMNFIGQARSKAIAAEGRTGYVAVQAAFNEVTMSATGPIVAGDFTGNQFNTGTANGLAASTLLTSYLQPDLYASDFTYSYANDVLQWLFYQPGSGGDSSATASAYYVAFYRTSPTSPLQIETGEVSKPGPGYAICNP